MCVAALALVGTVVSAVGSIAQGKAAADRAEYNAKVNEINAQAAAQTAAARADRHRRQGERFMGEQALRQASGGVDLGTGSPLLVAMESAENIELDAQTIMQQGDAEAVNFRNRAEINRADAKAHRLRGYIGAGAELINGLGQFGDF